MAEELTEAVKQLMLNNGKVDSYEKDVLDKLKLIVESLTAEGADRKSVVQQLIKDDIIASLCLILSFDQVSHLVVATASELIAELNKTDSARKVCTDFSMIGPLVKLLSIEDKQVLLQTCRALGNICYDNNEARNLVKDQCGVEKLITLLKELLEIEDLNSNLRTVVSGCLLNLSDTHEETQELAIQNGIVDVLLKYLIRFHQDEDTMTHCLLLLNCLADIDSGRKLLMTRDVLSYLVTVLDNPLSGDNLDSLLELYGNIAESDVTKQMLTELGLCRKLVDYIMKYQNSREEDSQNIIKIIADLVILLLTGDLSMDLVYEGGNGKVYKQTLSWLKSHDESLQIAGALAAGNFARRDDHCIQMVKDGVVDDLLKLLKDHVGNDGDIRLQHAILSALRNLAIPIQNKETLVQLGIIEKILPMMTLETYPVVFKLLGTLRMLVDKQETVACNLGQNSTLIKRLVQWCTVDDHPGVKGEATRLIAWLVKISRSSAVMQTVIDNAALPYLVTMINSEHIVMQNEALVAITLIASAILAENEAEFQKTTIMSALCQHLKSTNAISEVLQNVLTLLRVLCNSAFFKKEMTSADFRSRLNQLNEKSNPDVQEKCQDLFLMLDAP